ncbi:hypothetical protein Ct61P_08042 [Colletotrichum tofieldiae]|nr:hypothetical protein Ct61P_08042 [Colletotrichum tofieldiae]
MQLTTFLTILVTAGSVAAKSAKIQYYYDGGCSNYAVEFNVEAFTCINSGNIAGCDSRTKDCTCTFYENRDCSGAKQITSYDGPCDNCASKWGKGFKSVRCRIYG